MSDSALVSIVVNNFCYGRFLAEAIDSALTQSNTNTEVIVVDDGSTDNSADVIATYGQRITPLFKANAGQTSALNAGFARSTGEIVLFLDADDILMPGAVEVVLKCFGDPEVVHVRWHMLEIDARSQRTGKRVPAVDFPEENLRDAVVARGPDGVVVCPTSGNAWRRSFLDRCFPLATVENKFRTGSAAADARLSVVAPLYGRVVHTENPQGFYRKHGNNDYATLSFARKLTHDLMILDEQCDILAAHCNRLGIACDIEKHKQAAWTCELGQVVAEIRSVVSEGRSAILIDDGVLGLDRSVGIDPIPFLEKDGQYIGPAPDDETAIREMQRLRRQGAEYLVIAYAFWWLEHFPSFSQVLHQNHTCVLRNERLLIFRLQ